MPEDKPGYNATLWAVRSPREITCFRVQVDGQGRIVTTSVHDLNGAADRTGFDAAVRRKLQDRYGGDIQITVVADDGAGFDYFRREVMAGRYPVPPVAEPVQEPGQEGQQKLWNDPPQ